MISTFRGAIAIAAVVTLAISACSAVPPPVTQTATPITTTPAPTAVTPTPATTRPPASDGAGLVLPTGDCAIVVRQVHEIGDLAPEVATILETPTLGDAFRIEMDGDQLGTPVGSASVAGDGWGDGDIRAVVTEPDGTVEEYLVPERTRRNNPTDGRPDRIWAGNFRQVGQHVVELSATSSDCEATVLFDVVHAAQLVLPTGECAIVVRHIHVPDDMRPEVATILETPPGGEAYHVEMDGNLNGTPVAWVSAAGDGWSGHIYETVTEPDGTVSQGGRRPRNLGPMQGNQNRIWSLPLMKVGSYVVHLSSQDGKCDATLAFEVTHA